MKKFIHIAMVGSTSNDFGRAVSRGLIRFVHERGDWLLFPVEPWVDETNIQEWLRANHIAGVIVGWSLRDIFLRAKESGLPMVTMSHRDIAPGDTAVVTDSEAIGGMAAEFFLKAGFWHFAYCGYPGVIYSALRETTFRDILQKNGRTLHVLPHAPPLHTDRHGYNPVTDVETDRLIGEWLRGLPKPVAMLVCNDTRGQQLIRIAQAYGIDVPGEVAVLGVDNDLITCTMCHPPLSSIENDGEAMGYAAALALDGLLRKTGLSGVQIKIPPRRIVERQSTSLPPMENPVMIQALRIIRDSIRNNLTTKALCTELNCSRTKLDSLFKEHLGRTPAEEINRLRLKHVKELLQGTPLSLKKIAALCGFSSAVSLSRFVRRETSETPHGLRQAGMTKLH